MNVYMSYIFQIDVVHDNQKDEKDGLGIIFTSHGQDEGV